MGKEKQMKYNLAGKWQFALDGEKAGIAQEFFKKHRLTTQSTCRPQPPRRKRENEGQSGIRGI